MKKKYIFTIGGILLFLGFALYLFSKKDYLFFHLTVESATLIIGILIFTISTISRNFDQRSFIVTLGPGIFIASLITFLHIVTFKGMNIIPGYDANLPTQLWIVLNYILSVSVLTAILAENRRIKFFGSLMAFFCVGVLGTFMCFAGIFPICFVEGEGLTTFKKVSEYIIILIYLICIILIYRKKHALCKKTFTTMVLFLSLLIIGEFMFTLYNDIYGIQNFIGHYFRLIAFLVIYFFVIVESIQKPFNSIFSKIKDLSEQFESIIDHIPGLVFYKDTKNNFVSVNKYVAEAYKLDKEELEGKSISELYPEEIAKKFYEDDLEVINSGEAKLNIIESLETENDNRWLSTSKVPFIKDGKIIGVIGMSFDITDIINSENKLKVLQKVVEQSPAAIVITELDGTISYVNKAFELITGYTFKEAIGENPRILKFNNEAQIDYEKLWETILSGREWRGIFENKNKNGEIYWESASIAPLFDENGKITNFLGIKEDFTDRHRLELELEKLTRIDFLTKINNRRYFIELAEKELIRDKRYNSNSAFLMIDIDHFKKVNDKFGHSVGDEALIRITEVCMETIRTTDLMGRLGGEEFGIYLINMDLEEAMAVAERIRNNIHNIELKSDDFIKVELSVSIGVTKHIPGQESLNEIMKRADKALFKAKHQGRDRVAYL